MITIFIGVVFVISTGVAALCWRVLKTPLKEIGDDIYNDQIKPLFRK